MAFNVPGTQIVPPVIFDIIDANRNAVQKSVAPVGTMSWMIIASAILVVIILVKGK